MFYNHTVKTFLWKIRIWNKSKHRNIYLTHWSVWYGANDEIHGWLVERLFTEALFDGTGYQENTQQADDNDETDQPATHCWLLTIKNSSAKVAVQIFTAFMWCFLSDQWGNTYIACHLPVVPIHILRTFALADNGSGVPIEPGGVWCEVQRIGRALSRYIYRSQLFDLAIIQLSIPMVFSMVLPSTHPKWCQHLIPVKLLNLAPWGPCAASCSRRLCGKAVPPSHASCKYHCNDICIDQHWSKVKFRENIYEYHSLNIDLFQSLYCQPPWFQWVNCEVAFPTWKSNRCQYFDLDKSNDVFHLGGVLQS